MYIIFELVNYKKKKKKKKNGRNNKKTSINF